MDRVFVNITWQCQNCCPYCWHKVTDKGLKVADGYLPIEPDRTEDEWISALNKLSPACFDFVGGEPFLKDMVEICSNLDKKHRYAITTNLKSDTVEKFADSVKPDNCVVITGSYHPHSGFSETDMLSKLLLLRQAGFQVSVNIVDHSSITSKEKIKAFFEEHLIKANISPYEECHDLYIERKKQTLFCNGGLANYSINNNGDVYRCLTWFRFLTGYPEKNIVDKKDYHSLAQKGRMGNVFDGSFNKYKKRERCSMFCEWKNVVDPENSMVTDLEIRTQREELFENLKFNVKNGIKFILRKIV
jgi:hypothetical protein